MRPLVLPCGDICGNCCVFGQHGGIRSFILMSWRGMGVGCFVGGGGVFMYSLGNGSSTVGGRARGLVGVEEPLE